MKRSILFFCALLLISTSVLAATQEYSQIKGDYKCFILGEEKEIVEDKYDYLVKNKQISRAYSGKDVFISNLLDEEVMGFLSYYDNRLISITLSDSTEVSASEIDHGLKNRVAKIISMFDSLYGPPTRDFGYPNILQLTDGYITFAAKWVLQDKTITVGVGESDWKYYSNISITHNALTEEKEKAEEASEMSDFESDMSDF